MMNLCSPWDLQPQLPEGIPFMEEHATDNTCPAFCAPGGKGEVFSETWEILSNKHPKGAVNALKAAKATRYETYLPEDQFGGYFYS